ncbi:type A chloramphenicol O-acetyltransferase [Cytobacillus purgationiresistens]|uniref:Chloramphenicol O-acetyltransferase type A n=1 Tax=Cytobacillus purgationiresistens TaxID=863449 RepID=A0ABU0AKN8_9BACI|nr:type A chloramphenicol O-acetyltransferase [Cytobacillus purgationiresistens]MDQ0271605.1 chloramphenicol O-acetyltransferase type A [Cytobacillus purgationiresistens]
MEFKLINKSQWVRKEYFEYYLNQETTFSMTSEIDITKLRSQLKEKEYKFYPALLYMLTEVINSHEEFRTCFNEAGDLGYWTEMIPSYTVFNQEYKTFASIWTEGSGTFKTFHHKAKEDMNKYNDSKELFPKRPVPSYSFPVSMIPWTDFSGFNLNIMNHENYLLPIITAGQFRKKGQRLYLPLSLQMHHAVCDGYHASLFINELRQLSLDCEDWL